MATAQAIPSNPAKGPRSPTGIIFLTIFLDLVGFSIVFPLFPAMLHYYLPAAGSTGMLAEAVGWLQGHGLGKGALSVEVLFGGLLGSLYSVLQFFFAPFWGRLSDRVGRRTVLLGTVAGTALSYFMWIFAGQFWMLIVARGLGGIMSGNVAVGSAAIADVTSPEKRSKGMALVGIAFGTGFILGPAIGGMLSRWDLSQMFPAGVQFGINPFSACALGAFVLAVINYFWVLTRFPETLPTEKRAAAKQSGAAAETLSIRLTTIFRSEVPAIRQANQVNFYYTVAFSGLEFTLTFLAAERFGYTPAQMVKIFLFMGFVMVLVQGGMRSKGMARMGERKMSVFGMGCGVAGFLLLAFAMNQFLFYAGMAVFSVGAGLATVCLPALVSLYGQAATQGRHLGSARAAQALGRAVGPLFAALIYFWAGSRVSYSVGAAALLIPLVLAMKLPAPEKNLAQAA